MSTAPARRSLPPHSEPVTAGPVHRVMKTARRYTGQALLIGALLHAWPDQSARAQSDSENGTTAAAAQRPADAGERRAPSAALTRQAVSVISSGRPLSEMQRQIEAALGARLVLIGNAGDGVVQGEISGADGVAFVRELAARLRLEWAIGRGEVFLGGEGSAKPTSFVTPSAAVAARVATRANEEFEGQGSAIRVTARKEELVVMGLPNWTSQVAALRIPVLVSQAQAEVGRERRRPMMQGDRSDDGDPLTLMVFRLNNAYVDDKRLSVGSSTLLIPGVARLFRQFTGMPGGVADSVQPVSGPQAGGAVRVDRVERLDTVAGGRQRADTDRYEAGARGDRMTRAEQTQDDIEAAADRLERAAQMPAVIGDTRMNALIVRDRVSRMDMHRTLIQGLDQPADMVQLDAFVIDVKASRLEEFGLGFSWTGGNRVVSPNVSPGGANPGNSSNVILQGLRGIQLLANIRALESTGDTELLTVPSVVTLNNLEATFSARENFFVRVAGNQDASLTRVTAETLLKVTPLVSSAGGSAQDRRIRLLISVQDGSVDASESAVVDTLPRTLENQISTQAVVRGGDTLVIGGQVVRKRINRLSGLPIVNRIPVVGDLTNSRSVETAQFIRMYVVRPRLLGEDSTFAGNAQPLAEEDALSHPRVGNVRELMKGASVTPNRPDAKRPEGQPPTSDTGPELRVIPMPVATPATPLPDPQPAASESK